MAGMSICGKRNGSWTLLTGHGRVLVEIARDPRARIREIAAGAGVTERTAQAIVADLEAAGYITRTRTGRRALVSVSGMSASGPSGTGPSATHGGSARTACCIPATPTTSA